MINSLVIGLLLSVFSLEYLVRERGLLHPYAVLIPEALSAIAMLIVLLRMMAGVRLALDGRYVAFLALLALVLLFGFVLQEMPTGPVVAGVRSHLMFAPFFLLPAVYPFSARELKTQLVVLLALMLVQSPLAVYQRFVEYADTMETGDVVRGTATTSSALSILMMCGISILIALYLRRKLSLMLLVAGVGLLFLPTTLNETKGTLILLPLALLVPAFSMPRGSGVLRRFVPVVAVGALAGIAFVGMYNYLIQYHQAGQSLGQFVEEGNFIEYLYADAAEREVNYIGRIDSIEIAWEHISRDPLTLLFGMGAGNVSTSFLAEFDGEYASYYERYGVGMTQLTTFLWEVGLVGLLAYLLFFYFLWRDGRRLARGEDTDAVLGQIWVTIMLIMGFGLIYKSVFSMTEIGYLFWFYAGVVVSRLVAHRRSEAAVAPARERSGLASRTGRPALAGRSLTQPGSAGR